MRVHQLLKIVRVAQGGITHTRLGECAGIGQQSVTAFENGRASLSRKTLCAMASRLGISEASPCRKASLMTVSEDEKKVLLTMREKRIPGWTLVRFMDSLSRTEER